MARADLYDRIDPAIVYRIVAEDRHDITEPLHLLLAEATRLD